MSPHCGNIHLLDIDYSPTSIYDVSMRHPQNNFQIVHEYLKQQCRTNLSKVTRMLFSRRLAAFAATAAIASGSLAACGSPSSSSSPPSSSVAGAGSEPGQAGLPPGQGGFAIHSSTTQFNSAQQGIAGSMEGVVDGLTLTAVGTGSGGVAGGFSGQGGFCAPFGMVGTSASGRLGGVPFTVHLTSCQASSDGSTVTGTYTGEWGSRSINVTVTENLASDQARNGNDGGMGTDLPTFAGTIGSQNITGSVTMPETFATQGPNQVTGSITVS